MLCFLLNFTDQLYPFCTQTSSADTTYWLGTRLTTTMATCPVVYGFGDDYLWIAVTHGLYGVDNEVSLTYSDSVRVYQPGAAPTRCLRCTPATTPLVQVSALHNENGLTFI